MFAYRRYALLVFISVFLGRDAVSAEPSSKMEPTVVAIIDFQRVTRESNAGNSVRKQVAEQHAIFQSEIKTLQNELDDERKNLQNRQNSATPEVLSNLHKSYQLKEAELQKLVQARKQQLDQMFVDGMRKVEIELAEVVKNIAAVRGIDMIVNAARGQGVVLYADQTTVITDEARKALDQRLPSLVLLPPAANETRKTPPYDQERKTKE